MSKPRPQKQPLPDTPVVSVAELAAAAGCSIHTVRRLCKAGEMPGATRKSNTWLIPHESAETFARDFVPYAALRISGKTGRGAGIRPRVPAPGGCPPQQPQKG